MCVAGVQGGEPFWLHGAHFSGGEDQLLREEGRRVPEVWSDVQQGRPQVHIGCRLLKTLINVQILAQTVTLEDHAHELHSFGHFGFLEHCTLFNFN